MFISTGSAVNHDSDKLHAWNEWIKNGNIRLFYSNIEI